MSFSYINTKHLLPTFSFLDNYTKSQSINTPSLSKSFDWQNIDENIIIIRLKIEMQGAEEELERRSKFLNSLIQKKKKNAAEQKQNHDRMNVRVRASDMPLPLQNHAFKTCTHILDSMASVKLDSKRLALSLKKEFDSTYGPAWHCIVGTSFGSYVTHSLGGFLYFSIDKVYVLLFKTAVEPLEQ
ncbi:dynein light chain, cytoplasmic-like [Salvia splendens]|uniref:dynein light chain, cytoplasmic-like n=1 Tax=Salvia splendens TaxID=180675 RepID=UPI001C256D20|nr:dynein light chain, cytoplasmic-like [Salvia splendens]